LGILQETRPRSDNKARGEEIAAAAAGKGSSKSRFIYYNVDSLLREWVGRDNSCCDKEREREREREQQSLLPSDSATHNYLRAESTKNRPEREVNSRSHNLSGQPDP
jgi:hypothetical protein